MNGGGGGAGPLSKELPPILHYCNSEVTRMNSEVTRMDKKRTKTNISGK